MAFVWNLFIIPTTQSLTGWFKMYIKTSKSRCLDKISFIGLVIKFYLSRLITILKFFPQIQTKKNPNAYGTKILDNVNFVALFNLKTDLSSVN